MTPLRTLFRAERGSALLISMVMIVIITVLGLALFELGQIEGQQSGATLGEARAFEVAQAGLERSIRELRNSFLADPYGSESWVDGPNRPTCTPACETAVYRAMNLANNTVPETAPANTSFATLAQTGRDPGGTFVIELKQVLVAEANNPIDQGAGYTYPYGQTCIPSTPGNPNVCANLMFVRSTGTVVGPPGYTATSTVQALVKAASTSYFAGGLTAEAAGGNDPAVDGRALIAGSIGILGSNSIDPAFRIDGGAGAGMRNNWADLWLNDTPPTLARLTPRQLVCPTGANCAGATNLVESLGAELKIYGNVSVSNTMVTLNGGTDLGINAIQTGNYGDGNTTIRRGKGLIDGIYVANGCSMPCTTNAFAFNGGSLIFVDTNNFTKPYPDRPPKLPISSQVNPVPVYPTAEDPTVIAGTTYANWWAHYFSTHFLPSADLNSAVPNGGNCSILTGFYSSPGGNTIGAAFASLDDTNSLGAEVLRGFCHTFSFTNKAGVVTNAEICWKRNFGSNPPAVDSTNLPRNSDTMPTLEFGIPSCSAPNDPSNPLLIRNYGAFQTLRAGADVTIQYRGAAIIMLNTSDITIEQTLQTTCGTTLVANPTCAGERFPEKNLLILIQRGNGNTDIARNSPATAVERFMGYVYSESRIRSWRQTNIVGSLRAKQFCFNNHSSSGCAGPGTGAGNPRFFQANFIDLRKIPEELPASAGASGDRWLVDVVPRFWMVCRRSPTLALPPTPTGVCQYQ